MKRREFCRGVAAASGLAAGVSLAAPGGAAPADGGSSMDADPKRIGEPYELAGNRLVFTSWYWVRPGAFAWVNDRGDNVMVAGSEGPWGAHFRRSDYPHGIRLVARSARRVGPLLELERPWESKGVDIAVVLHEGGVYRGWGSCDAAKPGERPSMRPCYFESRDGRSWDRPDIGQVEFAGGRKNNLVDVAPTTLFVDPTAPEAERYKGVSLDGISREEYDAFRKRRPEGWEPRADRLDAGHIYALKGYTSPDGLRWQALPEPLAVEHCDTQMVAYYDTALRRYVLYTRSYMMGRQSRQYTPEGFRGWWGGDASGVGRRSIGRSETPDFRRFPVSEVILEPGPEMLPNDLLYTNCRTAIPGAPDHHLMFPAVWHTSDDTTSIAIASSHDGKLWHFLPGSPVLETAPFEAWDGGCVFAHPNLVELPDGAFALPYTGYLYPHKYPRGRWRYQPGLALWPKGRLVALEAPVRGEFATVAFFPPGRKLRINAVTERAGSILVEVAGMDFRPLEGRSFADAAPVVGDRHGTPVTWRGQDDLGHRDGTPVLLRFRMEQASLYALDFV